MQGVEPVRKCSQESLWAPHQWGGITTSPPSPSRRDKMRASSLSKANPTSPGPQVSTCWTDELLDDYRHPLYSVWFPSCLCDNSWIRLIYHLCSIRQNYIYIGRRPAYALYRADCQKLWHLSVWNNKVTGNQCLTFSLLILALPRKMYPVSNKADFLIHAMILWNLS